MRLRYYVITVAALATAVVAGLAIGSAALRGPVAAPVQARSDEADERNRELTEELNRLDGKLAESERLAEQLAPGLIGGRMAGRSVVVVATASAAGDVAGVEAMLGAGGATVAGRLELTDRFVDPKRRDDLLDLAVAALPPAVSGGLPATTDGVVATGALFGAVLGRDSAGVTENDRRGVLGAYVSQGFLTGLSGVSDGADAFVVLAGTVTGTDAGTVTGTDAALVTLATTLGATGTVVLAGSGAQPDSAVAQLRADTANAAKVSTVDNLSTPQGKLATAWALADQLAGKVGHYGTGPGAAATLPPTMPAAPPSPSGAPAEPPPPAPIG